MIQNKYSKPVDMPKLESPFIRTTINGVYVVTPEINPDYQWVFAEPSVEAIEKLDGTNVSLVIKNGKVAQIFNRTNELEIFGGSPIIPSIFNTAQRWGLPKEDGQYFGESVGDKIQANSLKIKERLWIPFYRAKQSLAYHSWHKHEKTFENISLWFKDYLFSLAHQKYAVSDEKILAEGVVFYHPDGVRMAKLRRDMFDWYTGTRHNH
jgi:hypothetical protein